MHVHHHLFSLVLELEDELLHACLEKYSRLTRDITQVRGSSKSPCCSTHEQTLSFFLVFLPLSLRHCQSLTPSHHKHHGTGHTHTSGLPIQISWIRAFIPRKESGDRRGIRGLLARGDPGAMEGKASSSSAQGGREGDERGREGSSPASENQNLGVFSSRDPWTNVFLFLALIIGLLRWSLLPRCTC